MFVNREDELAVFSKSGFKGGVEKVDGKFFSFEDSV